MSDALPLGRLVPVVPPPRRTALVPEDVEGEDDEDDPEPRLVADDEEPEEVLEEPEDPEPEEVDPLDPLDGGAERTGCCSE